jgi:hypothetical protein
VAIGQETGWASELVWTEREEEKSFASAGYRTTFVQFVQRLYNDLAITAPKQEIYKLIIYEFNKFQVL